MSEKWPISARGPHGTPAVLDEVFAKIVVDHPRVDFVELGH